MIKPLIIDRNYSISNNAAGQISRTFWQNVNNFDFLPTIITGSEIFDFQSSNNQIERVNDNDIIRHIFAGIELLGFPDLCYIPDRLRFSWCPFAFNRIKKICKYEKFSYVHSISNPRSSHLLAYKVKKYLGIPWVAQFDDPWLDSTGRYFKTSYFQTKDRQLEKIVAENADVIIHSNNVIKEIWLERYGDLVKDKIVILPFNFNVNTLPRVSESRLQDGKLILSHIGHIYNSRSSMTLLKALNKLYDEDKELESKIHVNFIGGIHASEKKIVLNGQLKHLISFIGTLPPESLEAYYQGSSMFLIIDLNLKRSPNYPSKLMMYFYYRRPIIGITRPNSQLEQELNKTGHSCFYYDDVDGLANMIRNAINNYEDYLSFDKDYWKKHTVENVNSELMAVLKSKLNL